MAYRGARRRYQRGWALVSTLVLAGSLAGVAWWAEGRFEDGFEGLFRGDFEGHSAALNQAPVIDRLSPASSQENLPFVGQIMARDPEGDALSYRLLVSPSGMRVDATGKVSWTPTAAGSFPLSVEVSDPAGQKTLGRFDVKVVQRHQQAVTTQGLPFILRPGDVLANAPLGVDKQTDTVATVGPLVTAPLGVLKDGMNTPAQEIFLQSNPVGVHRGPGIASVEPNRLMIGADAQVLRITGVALSESVTMVVEPGEGITVVGLTGGGDELTATIDVSSDAQASLRRFHLIKADGTRVPKLTPDANLLLLSAALPRIDSITPSLVAPGSTLTLTVRGEHLRGLPDATQPMAPGLSDPDAIVHLLPGMGIEVGRDVVVNREGTLLTVTISVSSNTLAGAHVVQVETRSGLSSVASTPANTLNVASGPLLTFSPVLSPPLQVIRGQPPPTPRLLVSSVVGVVRGPAITAINPAFATIGETLNLRLTGVGLEAAESISFTPDTGITVDVGSFSATAGEVNVTIAVAEDAPLFPRRVDLNLPDRRLTAPQLLEIRDAPPVVSALTPTFLLRDGQAQIIDVQGDHLGQALGARVEPDQDIVIQDFIVLSDDLARLVVVAAPTALLGPRVVRVLGRSEDSTAQSLPENTLHIVDPAQIVSPFVSPPLGVTKGDVPDRAEISLLSAEVGLIVGPFATSVTPATVARGSVTTMSVSGASLDQVAIVSVFPDDGVLIDNLVVNPDGGSLTFDLSLAADSTPGLRRVVIDDGATSFVSARAGLFEVLETQTEGPLAEPDNYQVFANGSLAVDAPAGVLSNDSDPAGGNLFAVLRRLPAFGGLALSADGSFSYIPDADFVGQDHFEYSASNGEAIGNSAVVTLSVAELDDAVNDAYSMADDQVLIVSAMSGLLVNDRIDSSETPLIVLESQPVFGEVQISADGSFTYTPFGGAGIDQFKYRLEGQSAISLPATVTISIVAVNDPPTAVDDLYIMTRGEQLSVQGSTGVLANDSDPDGDVLTATLLTNPDIGALSLNPNGGFVYTPPVDFIGQTAFAYEAVDGAGLRAMATVTIQVNDALTAVPDQYTLNEDQVFAVPPEIGLLANDVIVSQGTLRVLLEDLPSLGSVQVMDDGSFVYEPGSANQFGQDSFSYVLADDQVTSLPATVVLTIEPVNDPPVALPDRYLTDENAELVVEAPGLLVNDSDIEDDILTTELLTPPLNGVVLLRNDGAFTYVPDVNFRGGDSFEYTVVDAEGETANATVEISVTQPPTATNDVYLVDTDTPLEITERSEGLLANDHDAPERDTLFVVPGEPPGNGLLTLSSDGTLSYTPDPGFMGLDTFTYRVTDTRSESNIATVTLAVGITSLPRAVPDRYEVAEDSELVVAASEGVLINDLDADTPLEQLEAFLIDVGSPNDAPLDVTLERDGSFTVRPFRNFFGETFFVYQVFDGTDISNAAIVTIDVLPINDGVEANDDQYGLETNTVLVVPTSTNRAISRNDVFDEDFVVQFEVVQAPEFGTVEMALEDGAFTYIPLPDFSGVDSFVYRAFQVDTGISDEALVTLRTNAPPVAVEDTYVVDEDSLQQVNPSPLSNDFDPDGDAIALNHVIFRGGQNDVFVTVDQLVEPISTEISTRNHFYGQSRVRYTINDGVANSVGYMTVTVNPIADDPIAGPDQYLTQQNQPLLVNNPANGILQNDFDPDRQRSPRSRPWDAATGADLEPLEILLVETTSNGNLTLSPLGTFTYFPNTDFSGFDTFTYQVEDGTGRRSEIAEVRIRVNSPAMAVDDAYVLNEDTALIVAAADGVLLNDVDLDGDMLRAFLSVSNNRCAPCNGQVVVRQDGGFTYTPAQDFHGQDEFFYRVTDRISGNSIGRVGLTILPINDPPLTEPDTYRTLEDQILVAPEPQGTLRNDREVDGDVLVDAQLVTPAVHGSVLFQPDGSFTYTPDVDFAGRDTFTYRVFDSTGLSSDDVVEVFLTPVNDAPVAADDSYVTTQDTELVVADGEGLLSNDSDVDGPALSVALIGPPSHGSATVQADGGFVYRPDGFFSGVDQFVYQLDDGLGAVDAGVAVILVKPLDPEVVISVQDDFYSFPGPSVSLPSPGVLANDQVVGAERLQVSLVIPPTVGEVVLDPDGGFQYQAPDGFAGGDGFTYAAMASGVSELARVSLDIQSTGNVPPQAQGEQFGVFEDALLDSRAIGSLLLNDSDFEGDPLTIEITVLPAHGELDLRAEGHFTYQPASDYAGGDEFRYQVSDGNARSNEVAVQITVFAQNDAPLALDDIYQISTSDTLDVPVEDGILSNDIDVDGDALVVELVDAPLFGQLTVNAQGSFVYASNTGFVGTDTFRYAASDLSARALAQVTISVTAAANDPPQALGESFVIDEDHLLTSRDVGLLTANDSDPNGDALTVVLDSPPSNGSLTLNGAEFEYLPDPHYFGSDAFSYLVSDGEFAVGPVTVEIDIRPVNDPPIVATDLYTLVKNNELVVPAASGVLLNDDDIEGDVLSASLDLPPAHGVLTLAMDGGFHYQPNPGFAGRDEFAYRASDGENSTIGRVVIDVTASANRRPIAVGEVFAILEDTVLDTRNLSSLLANDHDPEGQALELRIIETPERGGIEVFTDGHIRYTPFRNAVGHDRIVYTVSDGELEAVPVEVSINLMPQNDPPVAQGDIYAVPLEESVLVVSRADGVLTNDIDPDGDLLVSLPASPPSFGDLELSLDGSFRYHQTQPAPRDSFSYVVRDALGRESEATVLLILDGSDVSNADVIFRNSFEAPGSVR